jgi:flagellar hook-length control protein FliK
VPVVAFEVLSVTAPQANRKPAAHADREDSTPFSQMLDKSDKAPAAKKKSATPHTAEDAKKDAKAQDSANTKTATNATAKDGAKGKDGEAGAKAAPDLNAAATNPDDTTAPPATPDTANDFLDAVAEVTGIPVAPVDAPKNEAKPADDSKSGDQGKDDAKTTDAKTSDTKTPGTTVTVDATPVAAVVAVPAQTPVTTEAAPADTAPVDVAIVAQGIAKAVVTSGVADLKDATQDDGKGDAKTDAKTGKPQTAVKLDTPSLLTDPLNSAKQAANPQTAQPQQAQAQAQAQKPAADATAQLAKPAQHDAKAPDVAPATKPADTTQPVLLVQNNGLAAPQSADQAAVTTTPAAAPQAAALPVQGIAIEIAGRALDGKKSFDIRLDPPELGKIHVRLDVDHKGEVTSIITADRSDTFDLLRRDAQLLERALQDAGIKTSSNGLQFSLRDQGQQNPPPQFANTAHVVIRDDTIDTEITAPLYRSLSGTRAGVDIRV